MFRADSPSPAKNRPCLPTSPTHIQAMRHATQQKHGQSLHALNSTGNSIQSPLSSISSQNSNSPHSQSQLQHMQQQQQQQMSACQAQAHHQLQQQMQTQDLFHQQMENVQAQQQHSQAQIGKKTK